MLPQGRLTTTAILMVLSLILAVALRMAAPSDLYDQDQPKTIAYTVDMAENGRYLLPLDMLDRPATKPPLYNWVGLPFLQLFGPSEIVLKAPSLLAAAALLAVMALAGTRFLRNAPDLSGQPLGPRRASFVALVAASLFPACYTGIKLIYLARPDMVLVLFLFIAWFAATVLLTADVSQRPARLNLWRACLWLAVAAAALTKGPPALLPVLYVVLGAVLFGQRREARVRLRNTGLIVGLPIAAAIVGGWLWAAYSIQPDHVKEVYLGKETVERIGGPLTILTDAYRLPAIFMACFAPWSIFVVLTLLHVPIRRWFGHPLGPANLWVLLCIVFFSLTVTKRPDYLAPAYPPAAFLAAYWLIVVGEKYRLRPASMAASAVVVVAILSIYHFQLSPTARTDFGERVVRFVEAVRLRTGDEPILFENTGYTPIQPLLGRNQPDPPTAADLAAARWIIRPIDEQAAQGGEGEAGPAPSVISEPISLEDHHGAASRFGLFAVP